MSRPQKNRAEFCGPYDMGHYSLNFLPGGQIYDPKSLALVVSDPFGTQAGSHSYHQHLHGFLTGNCGLIHKIRSFLSRNHLYNGFLSTYHWLLEKVTCLLERYFCTQGILLRKDKEGLFIRESVRLISVTTTKLEGKTSLVKQLRTVPSQRTLEEYLPS